MFDICVVGGGMVGAAISLGLGQQGLRVALVENQLPMPFDASQGPDIRVSAISVASQSLLAKLGAWRVIRDMRLCPYSRLSVWEKPACRTDFVAEDIQQPYLGHIIENRVIQLGLYQAMQAYSNITCFNGEAITHIQLNDRPIITLTNAEQIHASWLIGADGANSQVRQAAAIGVQGWQYTQQALAILIKQQGPQQSITWQQFTPTGPLAYLPLYDGYACLVWYHQADNIKQLKALHKDKLKQAVLAAFPDELTDFDILDCASFPLTRMHAKQYVKGRVVLAGDAAHTINPLAGQGVNIGFKDAAALIEAFTESRSDSKGTDDQGQKLQQYEQQRRADNLLMMTVMDSLYAAFSNDVGALRQLRNWALTMANRSGPIKKHVMKYAMGL